MIIAHRRQRIWLARHRVDFRRQHDGLLAESYAMHLDPFGGDVVIFIGRNRRSIKVLYADATGLWVSAKKFTIEAMKTKLGFLLEPSCQAITSAELAMITEGSSYTIGKKVRSYTKPIDARAGGIETRTHDAATRRTPSTFEAGTEQP